VIAGRPELIETGTEREVQVFWTPTLHAPAAGVENLHICRHIAILE